MEVENKVPGTAFRYASLDALRGIAALAVVCYHTTWPTSISELGVVRNSYVAVDFFFMLSGFVIAAAYHTRVTTPKQIGSFLARRIFRLYPLQWSVTGFLVVLELGKLVQQHYGAGLDAVQPAFTGTNGVWPLVQHLLLIQSWTFGHFAAWNPPSWSVSSETLLYALFALVGWAGWLRSRVFVGTAAALGLIGYALLAARFGSLDLTFDYGVLRCLAGFPIGVSLFLMGRQMSGVAMSRMSSRRVTVLEALCCVWVVATLSLASGAAVVLVIPAFAVAILVFAADRGQISRALASRPCQYLGEISYSLYLVHVPIRNQIIYAARALDVPFHRDEIGRVILDLTPLQGNALLLMFMALSIAVATATFQFIEKPARDFRRKKAPVPIRPR